jgi:hydroxyacylglutathione hydrolase
MSLVIEGRSLWVAQTNCYVVAPERGGPGIVIDAPPDADAIGALLASLGITPVALLVTHGHIDHAGGSGKVANAHPGVVTYLHPDDAFIYRDPATTLRRLMGTVGDAEEINREFGAPEHLTELTDGQRLELAGIEIDVLHTPGHTPGHCCFSVPAEGLLFSGDQLFAGSIGRTDLPGGNTEQLFASMVSHVLPLADDVDVLPGHGPATTIGQERMTNPFLQGLS